MSPYDEFEPTGEDVVIDVAAFDANVAGSPHHFDDELGYPSFDDEEIDALFAALKHPEAEAEFGNLGRLLGEVRSALFDRGDVAISPELAEYISVDDTNLSLPVYNGAELAREVALVDVDEMLRVFSTADDDVPPVQVGAQNRIHRVLAGAALAMAVVGGLVGAQQLRPATDDTVAGILGEGVAGASIPSDGQGEAQELSREQDDPTQRSLWNSVVRGALYGGFNNADGAETVADGTETVDDSNADASAWMSGGSDSVARAASENAPAGTTSRATESSANDAGRNGAGATASGASSVAVTGRDGGSGQDATPGSLAAGSRTAGFKAGDSTGLPTKESEAKPWSTGAGKNSELPTSSATAATESTASGPAATETTAPATAARETTAPATAAVENTAPTAPPANTAPATPPANRAPAAPPETTAPAPPVENPASADNTAPAAPQETTAPAPPVENPAPADNTAPAAPPENTAPSPPAETIAPEIAAPLVNGSTGSPVLVLSGEPVHSPGAGEALVDEETKLDRPGQNSGATVADGGTELVLVEAPTVPPTIPESNEPELNFVEAMGLGTAAPPTAGSSASVAAPEIGETVVVTDPAAP